MYIDIHSHLNLSPLKEKQEEVISKLREKGIRTITVGVDFETSKEAIALSEKYPDISFATVGLHPTDNDTEVFDFDAYKMLCEHEKVVGIGECGLDYFRDQREETKIKQKELFKKHITLAEVVKKPLMIHARPSKGTMDAYEDVLVILEEAKKAYKELTGNFHFFVGNIDIARKVWGLGFTTSFDGPITFTAEYDEVIREAPLDKIFAETDAPFAAPVPYRGQICEPWMVEEVIKRIAEIKKLPAIEIARQFQKNIERLFLID